MTIVLFVLVFSPIDMETGALVYKLWLRKITETEISNKDSQHKWREINGQKNRKHNHFN